ncbi:MAG: outer membrane lipid asymmetry maintenance protein MlaD [Pseudomonadota bacterium]
MKQNALETLLGAVVIAGAAIFLVFALSVADVRSVQGYSLRAQFEKADGLRVGTDVRISGVKVGEVDAIILNPNTYRADVMLMIEPDVMLPADTAALVVSEGLLGGRYLALRPGGDVEMLQDGEMIEYTQAAPNLEELLGRVIYSINGQQDG